MKEFKSINDVLDFAINSEQEAVDFYKVLANKATTDDMKQVFEEFAQEEIKHKARLVDVKETGVSDFDHDKVTDLKISDYVVNVNPSETITYQDALVLAMKKEKAAYKLYTALSQRTPNADMKKLFDGLAIEESKHKLRFEIEYDEYVMREN